MAYVDGYKIKDLQEATREVFGEEPHFFYAEVLHCFSHAAYEVRMYNTLTKKMERVLISYRHGIETAKKRIAEGFERLQVTNAA